MTTRNQDMKDRVRNTVPALWISAAASLLGGCYAGEAALSFDAVASRAHSGVATEGGDDLEPAFRVPRDDFGNSNTADDLAYEGISQFVRDRLDPTNRLVGLGIFVNERGPMDGVGPVFNQTRCMGCHENSLDIADFGVEDTGVGELATAATPISRAHRHGVTDYDEIENHPAPSQDFVERNVAGRDGEAPRSDRNADGRPPTAAFTLFGDFDHGAGIFNGLPEFGGPVMHIRGVGDCPIDTIPPEHIDPHLAGDASLRAIGERAGPPYVGRGLMEAVFFEDFVGNEDPEDAETNDSSLAVADTPEHGCSGDCISGRHNEGHADAAIVGGDPVVRPSRFGLRAAGPTLLQFMVGGSNGEVGLTSDLAPNDLTTPLVTEEACDVAPDPEITVFDLNDLRTVIRSIAPAEFADPLLEDNPTSQLETDVAAGASLFGLEQLEFIDLMTGDSDRGDEVNAMADDRQLDCVGCHIPVMATGRSPAREAGLADILSDKTFPIFSDLLIHDMGGFDPFDADTLQAQREAALSDEHWIPRSLSDFALPGQGNASGTEWRTPPLMSIGRVGPPFMHDARVFLNPDEPARIMRMYYDAANDTFVTEELVVMTAEDAVLAAIELHDLPPPPGNDYGNCGTLDIEQQRYCARDSRFRSEARLVMERFHGLTDEQQRQVARFLLAI